MIRILLVDDEQGMRNFLEKTLAPRCGNVQSAASAGPCLRMPPMYHMASSDRPA